LESASGYIRHELGERMKTRRIPELNFRLDNTMEKAAKVMKILSKIFLPKRNWAVAGIEYGWYLKYQ